MSLSDYTVTEAGFGFDLGGEKFLDIKCQSAGLAPKVVVMTTTIRALKYPGGADLKTLTIPNVEALIKGLPNLEKHLENAQLYNITTVIAINKCYTDSDEEIQVIFDLARKLNIKVALSDGWAKGGAGARDLAAKVIEAIEENNSDFKPLYNWEQDVVTKIETIAKKSTRS